MLAEQTDSELGPALMTIRGFQWVYGTKRDPYALLLRAESDDPHELGRRARDRGTVVWSTAEAWITAHHGIGAALLDDPDLGLSYPGAGAAVDGSWEIPKLHDVLPLDEAFLELDRADYRRLAGPVAASAGTDRLRAEVAGVCRESLGARRGPFDLADLVRAAAATAFGRVLGIPAGDTERFAALCADAAPTLDATLCPPRLETTRRMIDALVALRTLAAALVARPPAGGDLLARVRAAAPEDVVAVVVLAAAVGVDLATTLACNAVGALLDDPGAGDRVRADTGLVGRAVAETMRYAPPVRLTKLVARRDIEREGQQLPAGAEVVVLVEAANRDPVAYREPDRFDLDRTGEPEPLTVRDGLPAAVVAPLARLFATAVVETALTRLPGLRRASPPLRRLRSPVTGGLLQCPVTTD